jgi:hypothetical protein
MVAPFCSGMDCLVFRVIIVSCRATHAWRRLPLGAWTGCYGIVLCHPRMAAVVVGGRDWALRGMRKVRADASLHPALLWSTECETGDTQSTGECIQSPSHHFSSADSEARRDVGPIQYPLPAPIRPQAAVHASNPLSSRLRFGLSPLFSPWPPQPRHRQEHTPFIIILLLWVH